MSQSPSNGISIGLLVFAQGCRTLPEIWVGFLYEAYILRKWFWIDFNGKMETRHPVEDYFGSEFRGGGSVIIAELWRFEVARRWNLLRHFCVFFGKNDPLRYNFQNYVPKVFTALPIDLVVFKFRKICFTVFTWKNNFACLANCRYCARTDGRTDGRWVHLKTRISQHSRQRHDPRQQCFLTFWLLDPK